MGNPIQALFQILASAVSLYSTLCFVRIIFTWIPSLNYSSVGRFLSQLCDPYMNLFRNLHLTFGMLDFSAYISLGLLYVLSSVLNNIAQTGVISVSHVLIALLSLFSSVATTLLGLLLILLIVRFFVDCFSKSSHSYNSPWQVIDNSLQPIVFRLSRPISFGKPLSYKSALLISSIVILFFIVLVRAVFAVAIIGCMYIPF